MRRAGGAGSRHSDGTDYSALYTASTFVAYYAQRITSACVLNGARARGVFKVLGKARRR